jgi:cytochrome b involved in lipid metabolism
MLADYYIGNLNQTLKIGSDKTVTTTTNTTTQTLTPQAAQTTLTLTSAELTKHNSASSCWLLISGKIYDVTTFLNQHPGNASTILPTCGTDATQAYATRGGTGTHSSSANADLTMYYIGDLNQTVVTNSANPTNPPVANPNPVLPKGDDDDD